MNERKKFALGILIGIAVVSLLAFVPSLTDFNTGQFSITGNKVTIADAANFTNTGIRSLQTFQVDTNTISLRVFGFNVGTNIIQQWLVTPYPGGSPNVVATIDKDGVATFGGGVSSGPSGVRLTDTGTGKYWQWSELGAQSNIIERLPTNGNNGLSWGIKMWTNVTIAADGTPTNQAMNFQLGTGLSVDWSSRLISSSTPYTPFGKRVSFISPSGSGTLSSTLAVGEAWRNYDSKGAGGTDAIGAWYGPYCTNAVSGSNCVDATAIPTINPVRDVAWNCAFSFPVTNNLRSSIGVTAGGPQQAGLEGPTALKSQILVQVDSTNYTGFRVVLGREDGIYVTNTTAITYAPATVYEVHIGITNGTSSVFINGASVSTNSTCCPTNMMQSLFGVSTSEAAFKTNRIYELRCENKSR